MRTGHWLAAGIAALAGGGALVAWIAAGPDITGRDLSGLTGDVARGAYVARLSGCIGCHTDTSEGGGVLAGGAAIVTDFGSFYPPNITPHPQDGIGDWTLDDFATALTAGKSPQGRHYFPAFPYAFYTRLSDQDLVDLWAAVRSVPAVADGPPAHGLRFPFGFRQGVGLWKHLFFVAGALDPVQGASDNWNRGRYLAESAAHCGACHTPRNLLGGRDTDRRYEGGTGPDGERVPPITAEALAENGWTEDALAFALATGVMPDGDVFGGSMAEVVRDGTRYWFAADRAALAEYIMHPDAPREVAGR